MKFKLSFMKIGQLAPKLEGGFTETGLKNSVFPTKREIMVRKNYSLERI
jgi:hypothetical protein